MEGAPTRRDALQRRKITKASAGSLRSRFTPVTATFVSLTVSFVVSVPLAVNGGFYRSVNELRPYVVNTDESP